MKKSSKIIKKSTKSNQNGIGYIYIIRTSMSHKVYIGRTDRDVNTRFKEHMATSAKSNRKLYTAMRLYDRSTFWVETLGCYPVSQLGEWEKYYIKQFNSYKNGFNSNGGG